MTGDGKRCIARQSEKAGSPYFCPVCDAEVVLRKGNVRIHHFSHKVKAECQHGENESQQHLQAKEGLYEALSQHPDCRKCELERVLKGVRPDVSLYINDQPVAIEVQKSNIPVSDIRRRFKRYHELKINLVWVIPISSLRIKTDSSGTEFVNSLPPWQKFLSDCYFSRLYFWEEGAIVRPLYFEASKVYIEPTDWGGGYYKTLKNRMQVVRPPFKTKRLHLVDDFAARFVRQFTTYKDVELPDRRLWSDTHEEWW